MQTTEHQPLAPSIENRTSKTKNPSPWSALESERALHGTALDWLRAMGDHFQPFKAAFFRKQRKSADTIFCEKCFRHHLVVRLESPPDLLAFDPGTDEDFHCPDFAVTPADVSVWELNWIRLGRALCQALGLDCRFVWLNLLNTFQIGSWSADAVPVILTIQSQRSGLRLIVSDLTARLRQRFILLTPTNRNFDAQIQELLGNVQAAIFPLDATVALTENGVLQPRVRPGELFSRFTPEPTLSDDAALRAFAVIKSLDTNVKLREAPVLTVFRLYCIESFSVEQIGKKLRCSKATVINRLRTIRQKTGVEPKRLRSYSSQFSEMESSLSDSRARRIHRRAAMDELGADEQG